MQKLIPLTFVFLLVAPQLSAQDLVLKPDRRSQEELRLPLNREVEIAGDGSIVVEVTPEQFERLLRYIGEGTPNVVPTPNPALVVPTPAPRIREFSNFEWAAPNLQSDEAQRELTTQTLARVRPRSAQSIGRSDVANLSVSRSQIDANFQPGIAFGADDKADVPLYAKNSVVLKLADGVTPEQLDDLASDFEFDILSIQPELGTIHVRADLSPFMPAVTLDDPELQLRALRGLSDAADHFTQDPRIEAAAPDLIMRSQDLLLPKNVVTNLSTETSDWGIANVQADALWPSPRAQDGAVIGILDAGFGRHEDLIFSQTPVNLVRGDHGTHVAGIACARHANGAGLRGVLPNCFVVPKADPVIDASSQDLTTFMILFSQVVADLNRIINAVDGVNVFNVSLGYNWKGNFGIDPEDDGREAIRNLVRQQGEILISALENAQDQDKVIYSAAGNDSAGAGDRRDARYASAFNWAAIEARNRGDAFNGIVVEAHDQDGDRASFSNDGGHISCPGVDIFSTVALDANRQPSTRSYGVMSGTSMASPYCAAGHLLLALVRPSYTNLEIADCLIRSGDASQTSVPQVRLATALQTCPARQP